MDEDIVDGIHKHFFKGSATGNGDCFFDSVAQSLNQNLIETKEVTAKTLRQICQTVSLHFKNEDKEWLENALKYECKYNIDEYAARVCYTATDLEEYPEIATRLNLSSPIWGRPDIEGRMICNYYKVQIHLLEKQISNGDVVWANQLINENGSKSVDEVNWIDEDEIMHILNEGDLHFIPLLYEDQDIVTKSNSIFLSNFEESSKKQNLPQGQNDVTSQISQLQISKKDENIILKRSNESQNYTMKKSKQDSTAELMKSGNNNVVTKRQEGADKGDMYEIYLIMLMFTRGPLLKCNYEVGHEISAADKFDDVVLRYKNENSWKYRFFQAKHINNPEYTIKFSDLFLDKTKKDERDFKDYFDLSKYCSSYETILFEFKNGSFKGGELEDLIIFTNAPLDTNDLETNGIKVEELDKQSDELLYIPNTKYYKLTICNENEIKTLVKFSNIHKIAKKLVEHALGFNSKRNTFSNVPITIGNLDDIVVKYFNWLKKEEIIEIDEKLYIKFKSTFLYDEKALEDVKQFKELILKYYQEITKTQTAIPIIKENLLKRKIQIPKGILDKIDENIRAPSTHMAKQEGVNEFLNKLILAVNQPSADEFEKYILNKNTTSKLNIFSDKVVVLGVKHEILLWLRKKKNKEGWINGTNNSIIHETNAIAQILVINDPFESKVKKCQINWVNINVNFKNFLNSSDRVLILSTNEQTFFSAMKMYQMIQIEEKYKNGFVFTTDRYLEENFESIKNVSSVISILVIECQQTSESDKNSVYQQIHYMLNGNQNLKLILIATMDNDFVQMLIKNYSFDEVKDNFIWADLSDESKKQLLNSEINFQGKNVKLGDLINPVQLIDIDEESLANLALKKDIMIGKRAVNLSDVESFYIKFCQKIDLKRVIDALTNISNESAAYMFSGVKGIAKLLQTFNSEDVNLRNAIQFAIKNNSTIITDEMDDEKLLNIFKKMCKDFEEKTVYWLEFRDGNWYLQQIYQPELYINRQYIIISPNGKKKQLSDIEYLNSMNDQIVVLSDESGMGKTTSFTTIISKIKQLKPSAFIFNITLKISSKMINRLEFINKNDDFDNVVKFLLTVINEQQSTLSSLILRNMLESQNHSVYVFFDGFDEIPDKKCQNNVIKLVKYLNKKAKVWISTRPVYLETLEKELNFSTIKFKELNSSARTKFLNQFYEACFKLCFISDVNEKIEKCKLFVTFILKSSINTFGRQMRFLGVPLQLRLLAEGFIENCWSFINSVEKNPSTGSFNFFNIYEKFIKSKYEIYFKEKISYNQDVVNNSLCEIYNETHQLLALSLIFVNDIKVKTYLKKYYPKNDHKTMVKSIGIVQAIGEDGERNIDFIHWTFVEYFVAQFIVVNCVNTNDLEKNALAKELYRDVIHGKEMIHKFIDYLAIEDCNLPLHSAIINQDRNVFYNFISTSSGVEINAIDKFKRTALHLAVRHGNRDEIHEENYVNILLFKKCNMYAVDIFGRTVLHYQKYQIDKFLNEMSDYEIENFLRQPFHIDTDIKSSLTNENISFVNQIDCFGQSALQLINENDESNINVFQFDLDDLKIVNQLIIRGAEFSHLIQPDPNKLYNTLIKLIENEGVKISILQFICILILETSDEGAIKYFLNNEILLRECLKKNYLRILQKLLPGKILSESLKNKGLDLLKSTKNVYYSDEDYLLVVKFIINRGNRDECLQHVLQMCLNYGYTNTFNYLQTNYHDFWLNNICDCFGEAVTNISNDLIDDLLPNYSEWITAKSGFTILHFASAKGQIHFVKYLISKGSDPMVVDNSNRNSAYYAYLKDHANVFEYFATQCNASSSITNEFIDKITIFLITESNVNDIVDENGATLLHLACKLHKSSFVELLINRGADVNLPDKLGRTPMHYSALNQRKCEQKMCVQHLLSASAIYNSCDNSIDGITPIEIVLENELKSGNPNSSLNCYAALMFIDHLFTFASYGHESFHTLLPEVISAVNEKVLNARDENGSTLLHYIIDNDIKDNIPDHVIEKCANVQNDDGDTPLHVSVRYGCKWLIEKLLLNGANIYIKNNQLETPLQIASDNKNNKILSKFNLINGMFCTAYENEDSLLKYIACHSDDKEIILKAKYNDGSTFLHISANKNWLKVIKYAIIIFKYDSFDLDVVDKLNRSPLHYAAINKNDEIINLLLQYGCCYNLKDFNNETPFDLYKKSKVLSMVNSAFDLIQNNNQLQIIDLVNSSEFNQSHFKYAVNAVDRKGKPLSQYACEICNKQIFKLLLIHGCPIDLLVVLHLSRIAISSDDIIEILFYWKFDIFYLNSDSNKFSIISKMCNNDGETLLHMAIKLSFNIIKELIDNRVDVNVMDKWGNTPLHSASAYKRLQIVDLFIESGVNINARNFKGRTALLKCINGYCNFSIFCHLLAKGADVNLADVKGVTPLMSVNCKKHLENNDMLNILIKYGADVNAMNLNGETALVYAVRKGNFYNAKTLLANKADIRARSKDGKSLRQLVNIDNDNGPELRNLLLQHGAE
ncbi:Ankyrin repeat domain-containing protein 44 [Chamberlinius hualienensis]